MGEKFRTRVGFWAVVAATVAGGALVRADNILSPNDFIIAIDNNRNLPGVFNVTGTETPAMVLDQNSATKYLNLTRRTSVVAQRTRLAGPLAGRVKRLGKRAARPRIDRPGHYRIFPNRRDRRPAPKVRA